MTTVLDALQKGTEYLSKHGIDEARLNMQHLLAHTLKCNRMQLYVDFDRPLDETVLEKLRGFMRRRSKGEPLQHILGEVEFLGREFHCDERGLIPRPETERLTELLTRMPWPPETRILDVGTGSGVIGLSLVCELEKQAATATLADVSEAALALAEENRKRLEIDPGRVEFLQSDLFSNVETKFHLIAANLPYIPQAEIPTLSLEVQCDPGLALNGGEIGTEIMERFLAACPQYLEPGGTVAMEFGFGQADALKGMAAAAGLTDVRIVKDYQDQERFLFATMPNG